MSNHDSHPVRNLFQRVLLAAALGSFTLAGDASWGGSASDPALTAAPMGWLDDIREVLEEIIEDLEDADSTIDGEAEAVHPLQKGTFNAALDAALDGIDQVLDQGQYPSLDPGAGSIDTSMSPTTLTGYSSACLSLAYKALGEAMTGPGLDQDEVADHLMTIENLIVRAAPHNYRSTGDS